MSTHQPEINKVIQDVTSTFSGIGDPTTRAIAAGEMLDAVPRLQGSLREVRQAAVNELRDAGASYADVAKALGVSRTRVQQIVEGNSDNARKRRASRTEDPNEGTT